MLEPAAKLPSSQISHRQFLQGTASAHPTGHLIEQLKKQILRRIADHRAQVLNHSDYFAMFHSFSTKPFDKDA